MCGPRFSHQLLRGIRLLQRVFATPQLQVGKSKPQPRNSVVGADFERLMEITHSPLRLLQVVFYVTAVDIGFHHFGITLNGTAVVIGSLVQQL